MISVPHNTDIFVAIETVNFRNGINGLGRICRELMRKEPTNGAIFVFRNKSKTSLRILFYDGEAFWLLTRRLSRGKIKWWPAPGKPFSSMQSKELQTLIMNGNPVEAEFSDDWKKLIK